MIQSVLLLAAFLAPGGDAPSLSEARQPAAPLPQDEEKKEPHWTGGLTFGFTWLDGNTQSSTLNATFNAEKRGEKDRWTVDASSNYGKTKTFDSATATYVEETTSNRTDLGAKYDYFPAEHLYYYGNTRAKVDHVADLNLRYQAGLGAGYQWKETEKVKWGTELGLSYVDEDYEDDAGDADFLAVRAASNLTWNVSDTTAFEQVAEVLPSLEDSENVVARVDNRLSLNIVGSWIAQIQYVLDFNGAAPSIPGPEKRSETDHRVVIGLGWSFGGE